MPARDIPVSRGLAEWECGFIVRRLEVWRSTFLADAILDAFLKAQPHDRQNSHRRFFRREADEARNFILQSCAEV